MPVCAIIAAAGSSVRMGGADKVIEKIGGKSVILYSLLAFSEAKCVKQMIVCASKNNIEQIKSIVDNSGIKKEIKVVLGGKTRQDSVSNAFSFADDECDCVMIHDAARPMISAQLIEKLYEKVKQTGAAALAVPVKDTVKVVDENGKIVNTPDRSKTYLAQTPQGFLKKDYETALKIAVENNMQYTDDCQLFESIGKDVFVLDGDYKNIKITTGEDLLTAKLYLGAEK